MVEKIAIFWVILFLVMALLHAFPRSPVSLLAFSWFGPTPEEGEFLSSFKLRRVKYAFSWLIQLLTVLAVVYLIAQFLIKPEGSTILMLIFFALPFGIGTALLATVGFAISWAKTLVIGPNGQFVLDGEEEGPGT